MQRGFLNRRSDQRTATAEAKAQTALQARRARGSNAAAQSEAASTPNPLEENADDTPGTIGERLRQLLAQDLDRVYLVASDLTVKQQR